MPSLVIFSFSRFGYNYKHEKCALGLTFKAGG